MVPKRNLIFILKRTISMYFNLLKLLNSFKIYSEIVSIILLNKTSTFH